MYKFQTYLILLVIFSVLSCSKSIDDASEYYKFLEAEENGLTKTREVLDVEIKAKYLPAEYLCYQEMKTSITDNFSKDSLLEYYKYNASFLVTIGPSQVAKNDFDITKVGIRTMDEFNKRAHMLNFEMGQYFKLTAGNQEYKPVFCEMENMYDLDYGRKFNLVFSPLENKNELIEADEFLLTYDDKLLNTGVNNFRFKKKDINAVPEINFWNK